MDFSPDSAGSPVRTGDPALLLKMRERLKQLRKTPGPLALPSGGQGGELAAALAMPPAEAGEMPAIPGLTAHLPVSYV